MSRSVVSRASNGIGVLVLTVVAHKGAAGQVANAESCPAGGEHVVARRWDAVLGKGFATVRDCAHPEWPSRSVVTSMSAEEMLKGVPLSRPSDGAMVLAGPLVIRAGETVMLRQQTATVRIEMSGVVEQAARLGDRVTVRVSRMTQDAGLFVERIAGTVRGAGNVEMER